MDSERIKCPVDGGKCGYVRCIALGHCWARPPKHEGTAVLSSSDPTTAGSEDPAGPSRRRSLPALAAVLDHVVTMREEAQVRWEEYGKNKDWDRWRHATGELWALTKVLCLVSKVSDEEPEGNTEVRRPADNP